MSDTPADQPPDAAPEPSFSLAPTRAIAYGQEMAMTAPPYAPPAPTMSPMRYNGVDLPPYIAPEPAPLDRGIAQKAINEGEYWGVLARYYARSRADLDGIAEDKADSAEMLTIRRTRNELGRDFLYAFELEPQSRRPFAPRRRHIAPPVDRRGWYRG